MSKFLSLSCAALCLGAALLGTPECACPAERGEPSAAEKKIAEALKAPTEMEFIETPLQDVIDTLEDYHEISVKIDQRALEDVGIPRDCPISCSLKGVSLRSALRLMLRDLDLTYVIRNEVLLITTPEEAENMCCVRVYPVDDLLGKRGRSGSEQRGCESLIQAVKTCIAPDAWKHVGGPGSISSIPPGAPTALIVNQCQEVHDAIADFLGAVRQAAQRPAHAPFEPVGGSPLTAATEKKIAEALKSRVELQFIDTPLQDVADTLEDKHKIQVQVDSRALDYGGIPSDKPITADFRGISLASGFRLMLRQLDLTYVIRDEVLSITTPEEAGNSLITNVYPLSNLTAGRREAAQAGDSYDDGLVETITDLIAPESWDDVGGPGSLSVLTVGTLQALVVRQTRVVHDEIERLLLRPEFRQARPSARASFEDYYGEEYYDDAGSEPARRSRSRSSTRRAR